MAIEGTLHQRARAVILAALFVLAAAAWVFLIGQAAVAGEMVIGPGSLTMGLAAPLFLAIWIVMMVAMMFPTAAPMVLTFATIAASKQERGQPYVPTWVFVGAYLLIWSLFGLLAYGFAVGLERWTARSMWAMAHLAQIGGGVLILAGLYQLSPLKHACLAKCRTPLQFVLSSWRDGWGGAFRMGLAHGLYCLGCCWLLFLILFPLGVMNVAVMAVLAALIFAEKSLPAGRRIGQLAAAVLIVYGLVVVLAPAALPIAM